MRSSRLCMDCLLELLGRMGLEDELASCMGGALVRLAEVGRLSGVELASLLDCGEGGFQEAVLAGKGLHLFFQARSCDGTLEWDSAYCLPSLGDIYEMPPVVRRLILDAVNGRLNWKESVVRCFSDIGEDYAGLMPRLVELLVKTSRGGLVSGVQIRDACLELGIPFEKISPLIAELKGVGIIAPWVRRSIFCRDYELGRPLYLFNFALFNLIRSFF